MFYQFFRMSQQRHLCRYSKSSLPTFRSYSSILQPTTQDPSDLSLISSTTFAQTTATRKGHELQLKTYKPRTPGLRHLKRPINDHLWKGRPLRQLTFPKKGHGKGGRNNLGRVTVRHRGGGHKRRIRTVDFARTQPGQHSVERIEYDPNRSAHLALLLNEETKEKTYIIAAEGMRAGDKVQSFMSGIPDDLLQSMGGVEDPGMLAARTAFRGNCLPMHMIPLGTEIYNVGSRPGKRAVFCRSAGTFATVVARDETLDGDLKDVVVRLQSGEVRKVDRNACATIGVASNSHWHFRQLGKAGRSRWLNIRPTVRGVAMNAGIFLHCIIASPANVLHSGSPTWWWTRQVKRQQSSS